MPNIESAIPVKSKALANAISRQIHRPNFHVIMVLPPFYLIKVLTPSRYLNIDNYIFYLIVIEKKLSNVLY